MVFLSDFTDTADEIEKRLEEIEISGDYVPIERIPSHEAYQWMENFVAEIVAPKDARAAEKLSIALMGKGAFRRFKDVLHSVGDEWVQAWYHWRDDQLHTAMKEWFESLPLTIIEELPEKHPSLHSSWKASMRIIYQSVEQWKKRRMHCCSCWLLVFEILISLVFGLP